MSSPPGATQVLIADDSPLVLRVLETMFEGTGFEVITARDGLEAIEKAFSHDVSLIILDVMMPRLNGYQTCRLLKNEPQTKDIPVIILTSKDQVGDRDWGLQTGADHYLTKDEAQYRLLELVAATLAEWRSRPNPPPAKRRTGFDILSRVNDLLDRQLYEATVLSEIGQVARHLVQFDETLASVLGLVARVVDFALAAVAFVDAEDLDSVLVIHHPVSPAAIDVARQRLAEEARQRLPKHTLGEVRTRLLTLAGAGEERFEEDQLESYRVFPMVTNERLSGVIALAGEGLAHMTPETEAFLARVAHQSFIVVENSRLVERLRNLSLRDGLTDLYNHRHIMEIVGAEFQRASRYDAQVSLLMLDIDHFKRINDTHGHQVGDVILRDVARLFVGALRSVDAVGRYGGEEFMVVLPHTGFDEARRTAERLRRVVNEHEFRVGERSLHVTVSVGVAGYPQPELHTVSDFIRLADRALYRAKERGRNCVVGAGDPAEGAVAAAAGEVSR